MLNASSELTCMVQWSKDEGGQQMSTPPRPLIPPTPTISTFLFLQPLSCLRADGSHRKRFHELASHTRKTLDNPATAQPFLSLRVVVVPPTPLLTLKTSVRQGNKAKTASSSRPLPLCTGVPRSSLWDGDEELFVPSASPLQLEHGRYYRYSKHASTKTLEHQCFLQQRSSDSQKSTRRNKPIEPDTDDTCNGVRIRYRTGRTLSVGEKWTQIFYTCFTKVTLATTTGRFRCKCGQLFGIWFIGGVAAAAASASASASAVGNAQVRLKANVQRNKQSPSQANQSISDTDSKCPKQTEIGCCVRAASKYSTLKYGCYFGIVAVLSVEAVFPLLGRGCWVAVFLFQRSLHLHTYVRN